MESPDLKNRVLSKCMPVCLSACSVREKSTYSITTKYVYAHRLQHAMARVVSEATGRTLAEGEWGRRTSRGWVFCNFGLHTSNHYREILYYQVTSWKSERKFLPVSGIVYCWHNIVFYLWILLTEPHLILMT